MLSQASDTDQDAVCYYSGFNMATYCDMTVTDPSGREIVYGDTVVSGTELTVKITLNENCRLADNTEMYVQGNYYKLDKNNSFKFTVNYDYSNWFYIDFVYGKQPTRTYTIKIKGDSHVKSYEFLTKDEKKISVPAGEKSYTVDEAWALSSGSIALKVIPDDGYECGSVQWNTLKVKDSWGDEYTITPGDVVRTSDSNIYWVSFVYDKDYTYTLKVTSKKEEPGFLDSKKYTITAPKIKTPKFKKEYVGSDEYTSTTTITFGKGKKATEFKITSYREGKKGDVSSYLDYYSTTIGSDAAKYEIIDLSGLTGFSESIYAQLVERIYHYYKQDKLPNLKAIMLPKEKVVSIMGYDDEYAYYPIWIISVH